MTQSELNRQVALQLGESIQEVARRGFSLVFYDFEVPAGPQVQDNEPETVFVSV